MNTRDEKVLVPVVGDDPDFGPLQRALDGADDANARLVAPRRAFAPWVATAGRGAVGRARIRSWRSKTR